MNDFETRLSLGLKRYADFGETGPDLEAHVRRAAAKRRRTVWLRWIASAATLAAVMMGGIATFPRWAAAAQEWPIVGPVVNEYIVRHAGLKDSYDSGMLKGVLLETSSGPVTFRILGVAADRVQTVLVYQVLGLTEPPGLDRWWNRPEDDLWSRLNQQGRYSDPVAVWATVQGREGPGFPQHPTSSRMTPFGLFGTVLAPPVAPEGSEVQIAVTVEGRRLDMQLPVSRTEADKRTREIAVRQSQEIGGITYTVDSVVETPVAMAVRVRVEKPSFHDSVWRSHHDFAIRLENPRALELATFWFFDGDYRTYVFPKVDLPASVIVRADVKGVPNPLTWPLEKGAVQQVDGNPITLSDWMVRDGQLLVEWVFQPEGQRIVSFGEFEALDATGTAHPLQFQEGIDGHVDGNPRLNGPITKGIRFVLPPGVQPVAIRANRLAEVVEGPWTFAVTP